MSFKILVMKFFCLPFFVEAEQLFLLCCYFLLVWIW